MRVLVTGASGFIGAPLVSALLSCGVEVIGLARRGDCPRDGFQPLAANLLDATTDRLIETTKADLLIHTAWVTAHGAFWNSPENSLWRDRSLSLARAFLNGGGRHIMALGTCVEYDLNGGERLDEYASALNPVHPYGIAKHETHQAIAELAQEASSTLTWCRIFHLFGRNEHPARLVPSVVRALLKGEEARTTTGMQKRDFLHADDAAGAIAHLALGGHHGNYNIGSGESITIVGLVNQVAAMLGAADKIRLGALPLRPDEPMSILPRIDRLSATGFKPLYTLEQGLEDIIKYWKATA